MYKVQRGAIIVILMMISLTFYGCNQQKNDVQDKLHAMLHALKNYEADATITFLKDTKANVIKMKQAAEIGGKYKLTLESPVHLKGYITSYDGKEIHQYNPNTNTNVLCKPSEARNQALFSSFVHNYLNVKDFKTEKETLEGRKVITIEMLMPGDYKYMAKEKVWFDEEKLVPIKMEIYDADSNTTIQIIFDNFKYNAKINF